MRVAMRVAMRAALLPSRDFVMMIQRVPRRADRERLEELLAKTLNATSSLQSLAMGDAGTEPSSSVGSAPVSAVGGSAVKGELNWREALTQLAGRLNLTEIFMHALGSAAHVTENSIYIVLFLAVTPAARSNQRLEPTRGGGSTSCGRKAGASPQQSSASQQLRSAAKRRRGAR